MPKAASESERTVYLLDRALRSQGVVSLDSICHLDAPRKAAMHKLISSRVRRKELVPVALDGSRYAHWAAPEMLDAPLDLVEDIVHILNPFDPLVIQRKRLAAFFEVCFGTTVARPSRALRERCGLTFWNGLRRAP